MSKPIYQPKPVPDRRKSQFGSFLEKYPSPFWAWLERQRSPSVQRYWRAMLDPLFLPEIKVLLDPGLDYRPTCSQDLWDAWFRAAYTMLVKPIRGRVDGDFTTKELAAAFGINPGRVQGQTDKEKAWRKRSLPKPPEPVRVGRIVKRSGIELDLGDVYLEALKPVRRGPMAGQPWIEDLIARLIK